MARHSSVDSGANQLLQKLYESLSHPCKKKQDYSCFILSQQEELEDASGITSRMSQEERDAFEDHGYLHLDKFLGSGRHGRVFLAAATPRSLKNSLRLTEVYNNKAMNVAIKIIDLDLGYDTLKKFAFILPNEIANMNEMYETDYSIKLLDTFLSHKKLFLVTELMDTNLRDAVKEERILSVTRSLKIANSRRYFFRTTRAVYHLHNRKIAHRDLKPANIYMNYKDQEIKLGDFGLSFNLARLQEQNGNKYLLNICGTLPYMAPEVVNPGNGKYDPRKADMWSLGILLFYFITGFMLFPAATIEQLIQSHLSYDSETYPFSSMLPKDISQIVKNLLNKNPSKRPNADEILRNDWFYPEYLVEQWNDIKAEDIIRRKAIKSSTEIVNESVHISEYLTERVSVLSQVGRLLRPIKTHAGYSGVLDVVCVRIPTIKRDGKNMYEVWKLVKENKIHINNKMLASNEIYFSIPNSLSNNIHTRKESFSRLDLTAYREYRFKPYQPVIIIKKLPPVVDHVTEDEEPGSNCFPLYNRSNIYPISMYMKGMHFRPVGQASIRDLTMSRMDISEGQEEKAKQPMSALSSVGPNKVRTLDPEKRVTKVFSKFVKTEVSETSPLSQRLPKRKNSKHRKAYLQQRLSKHQQQQEQETNEQTESQTKEEESGFLSNIFGRILTVVKSYYQFIDENETQVDEKKSKHSAVHIKRKTSNRTFTRLDWFSDDSAASMEDSDRHRSSQHTIQTLFYSPPSDGSLASQRSNITNFINSASLSEESDPNEPSFNPDVRAGYRRRRRKRRINEYKSAAYSAGIPDLTPHLRSNLKANVSRRQFS